LRLVSSTQRPATYENAVLRYLDQQRRQLIGPTRFKLIEDPGESAQNSSITATGEASPSVTP